MPKIKKNPPEAVPRVVLGYGRTGKRFAETRGNIGFWFIDYIFWRCVNIYPLASSRTWKTRRKFMFTFSNIDPLTMLVKPRVPEDEYVKFSGKLYKLYNLPPEEFFFVFPDISMKIGTYRVDMRGGIDSQTTESLESEFGTNDYTRIHLGVADSLATTGERSALEENLTEDDRLKLRVIVDNLGMEYKLIPKLQKEY